MTTPNIYPNTPEWYAARSKFVGASEIAGLFGLSPHSTKLEIYLRKTGKAPEADLDAVERVFWGNVIEPVIADAVTREKGWLLERSPLRLHPTVNGMAASPDRIITSDTHPEGQGVLEIKNVDGIEYLRKWKAEEFGAADEPPINYLLQLQHQVACTGATWGAIAALVGGNRLEIFEYKRHPETIAKIEQAVREFWVDVETGNEPPATADDYDTLTEIYRLFSGGPVLDLSGDNEMPVLCISANEARDRRLAAEKEEKAAKAAIIQRVGAASGATCSGFSIDYKMITRNDPPREAKTIQYRTLKIKETA